MNERKKERAGALSLSPPAHIPSVCGLISMHQKRLNVIFTVGISASDFSSYTKKSLARSCSPFLLMIILVFMESRSSDGFFSAVFKRFKTKKKEKKGLFRHSSKI